MRARRMLIWQERQGRCGREDPMKTANTSLFQLDSESSLTKPEHQARRPAQKLAASQKPPALRTRGFKTFKIAAFPELGPVHCQHGLLGSHALPICQQQGD
ncbi:hypothetical protein ACLOJK_031566 [Asimina triloba]